MITPTQDEYVPFGPQWEAEMMKIPKKILIHMLRKARIEIAAVTTIPTGK